MSTSSASHDAGQPPASGIDTQRLTAVLARDDEGRVPVARRQAAVAAVFREGRTDTDLLFIQRAEYEGDPWSGHMAFPGGRVEPDDRDTYATAERETLEELGLDLSSARRLGSLAETSGGRAANNLIAVSAHCYWLDGERPDLAPNYEVAATVWVPLSSLLDQHRYIDYWYPPSRSTFPGIQLDVDSQVIWGLTLRFLADLFERLEQSFIIG
jgi:8-oxo-dGTP pyrophosphatase MutT (NUDIX family)